MSNCFLSNFKMSFINWEHHVYVTSSIPSQKLDCQSKLQGTNLQNEDWRNFSTAPVIKWRKEDSWLTFEWPVSSNSLVHRACSHDAPKNFVLPLLEHQRLAGSYLVITRRRTGTGDPGGLWERERERGGGVSARLENIRSRKNTKYFADYSRSIGDSTRQLQTQSHHQGVWSQRRSSRPRYTTTSILSTSM